MGNSSGDLDLLLVVVSFNSAGREGRPALALRIVHTGCTAGGLEHPRVVLVGLVFLASLLPVGRCFSLRGWIYPRSHSGHQAVFCFYGSRAGWETRSRKPESTPPRGTGGRDGPDPARLVE